MNKLERFLFNKYYVAKSFFIKIDPFVRALAAKISSKIKNPLFCFVAGSVGIIILVMISNHLLNLPVLVGNHVDRKTKAYLTQALAEKRTVELSEIFPGIDLNDKYFAVINSTLLNAADYFRRLRLCYKDKSPVTTLEQENMLGRYIERNWKRSIFAYNEKRCVLILFDGHGFCSDITLGKIEKVSLFDRNKLFSSPLLIPASEVILAPVDEIIDGRLTTYYEVDNR